MKKYKAASPEETVERIHQIMSKAGIPLKDQIYGDGDMFCSYRLTISEDDNASIGTNGKGMKASYAKASAYAEMMERFQNRVVIDPNPAHFGYSCVYFPDEKVIQLDNDQLCAYAKEFLPRTYPKGGITVDSFNCIFLPCFHVNTRTVRDIPYSIIRAVTSSNGMCAGNIPEEALIQGFNEIFERHCLQELYLRRLTPPTIPDEFFDGTDIIERLRRLEAEYGLSHEIKDCSLGEGYPVIGLLLYNRDRSKYIVHLGADLSAVVALERCFTETFQGHTADTLEFQNELEQTENLDYFNEFKRSIVYGRGRLPEEFFSQIPSYTFTGHTTIKIGSNFREDFQNICLWLEKKGFDIYIRDNSFMGFPAFHICVPELSDLDSRFCHLNPRIWEMKHTETVLSPLYHLLDVSEDQISIAIGLLEMMKKDVISMFPQNTNRNNSVNRLLVLMILYHRLGNKEKAIQTLQSYIDQKVKEGKTVREYYLSILAYLKTDTPQDPDSKDSLIARSFVAHPEQALHSFALPDCFHCDRCELKQGCRIELLKKIEDVTQRIMKENTVNQQNLISLFDQVC